MFSQKAGGLFDFLVIMCYIKIRLRPPCVGGAISGDSKLPDGNESEENNSN